MQLNLTEEQKTRNKRTGKKIEDILFYSFMSICVFCLLSLGITNKISGKPNVLGYRVFYIETNSMEPTIMTGQWVVSKPINPEDIEIGDIVAYKKGTQTLFLKEREITIIHRVTEIKQDVYGNLLFRFKGDNNKNEDPYDITEDMIMYKIIKY